MLPGQTQILTVRATGDLLRQRAAAQAARQQERDALLAQQERDRLIAAAESVMAKKSLYLPPQTGTHFLMSDARPEHIASVPYYLEPFLPCPDRANLLKRLRAGDEAKLQRQQAHGCTVVYDSIDPNPDTMDANNTTAVGSMPNTMKCNSIPIQWQPQPGNLPYYYVPTSSEDTTLVFESRFEGGNLRRAIQVSEWEYDLLIRPDINTASYAQWFYFSIRNTRAAQQQSGAGQPIVYKFNLVNLQKSDSLFNSGMQPLIYSTRKTRDSLEKGKHVPYQHHPFHSNGGGSGNESNMFLPPSTPGPIGWYRGGYDIAYYRSSSGASGGKKAYTLTFSLEMEYDHDCVYLAFSYPYTISMLYRSLDSFESDIRRSCFLRQRVLCRTLGGNDVPLVMITDFSSSSSSDSLEFDKRPAVVITARVHPGESNASWIMKGIMEFLLTVPGSKVAPASALSGAQISDTSSHAATAAALRKAFVFYLVPCLNPDGVISGNYRCSLSGVDLNRQWLHPDPAVHPTIWKTKQLLARILGRDQTTLPTQQHVDPMDEKHDSSVISSASTASSTSATNPPPREIAVFCDLHGHSRAQNVFIYGVECDGKDPTSSSGASSCGPGGSPTPQRSPHSSPSISPFPGSHFIYPSAASSVNAPIRLISPSPSPVAPTLSNPDSRTHRLAERVLPKLLSLRSPFFNLEGCHFQVRKSKETTARVVVAREMGVINSFTLEASFGGVCVEQSTTTTATGTGSSAVAASPSFTSTSSSTTVPSSSPSTSNPLLSSKYVGFQFNTRMYEEMGWNLCQSLLDWSNPSIYTSVRSELESTFPTSVPSAASSPSIESVHQPPEDSDDDAAAVAVDAATDGAKVRTRVGGGKRKKKRKDGKEKRRSRSKSTDGRSARGSSAARASSAHATSISTLLTARLTPAAQHVRALLEKLSVANTSKGGDSSVTVRPIASSGGSSADGSDVGDPDGDSDDESSPHASPPKSKVASLGRRSSPQATFIIPTAAVADSWFTAPAAAASTNNPVSSTMATGSRARGRSAVRQPAAAGANTEDETTTRRRKPRNERKK